MLKLGERHVRRQKHWHNYVKSFGFTDADISELMRMALDPDLNTADTNSSEVWAPVHAWRSLGQLRATDAIDPLLDNLEEMQDDDYFREDLKAVLALIGPEAIPSIAKFIKDPDHTLYPKWSCIDALVEFWKTYPEARADCVAITVEQLQQFHRNSDTINAVLINNLIDMNAVETADLMKQAYASKRVDLGVLGDWIDAQRHLGLISAAEAREQRLYVDAEHLSQKAAKPITAEPKGFGNSGSAKKSSSKKKKKS
ncbi:MAG: PBS lyase [Cyanobacteria bacterium J06638_20]